MSQYSVRPDISVRVGAKNQVNIKGMALGVMALGVVVVTCTVLAKKV